MFYRIVAFVLALACHHISCPGETYFLTIGGGYSPAGNQASIERNVLYFQRVLAEVHADAPHNDVFFSDGKAKTKDVQVVDSESVPVANRLMAEFFGRTTDLGLSYRDHEIKNVRDSTRTQNIKDWFSEVGGTMRSGDRLFLYVTSHGSNSDDRRKPYNTSITLWNRRQLSVQEMDDLLAGLPEGVSVVTVMVQCHAGGFARSIYQNGESTSGFRDQVRAGFFATVHDRPAAGCTPDADEASYVEYSTYFWEALSGKSRLGEPIDPPDYDGDGRVSFDEAHAYTIIQSGTIDLPIKTSGELLGVESGFRDRAHPDLMPRDAPYGDILKLATPSERAILESLSEQLELKGDNRLLTAAGRSSTRGRGRTRSISEASREASELRQEIAGSLRRKWPQLANVLNPLSIDLLTSRSDEFVKAVHSHPEWGHYCRVRDEAKRELNSQEKRVKFERFVRTAENVIMRANLYQLKDNDEVVARYEAIVAAEKSGL